MHLTNEEMHHVIRHLVNNIDTINQSELSDSIYGTDYYDKLLDTGVAGFNRSIGSPTNNTINRYYDEKRNYSLLAPTLDPTSIVDISKRAKEYIKKNDWSESLFFSSAFDKDEVEARLLEKSIVYSKRLEWWRINEVKRRPPFAQLIGINLMILDKLDNILRYVTKQYIHEKIETTPKGKNFYVKGTFTNGAVATRFDFTDLSKCKNTAGLNVVNFPSTEMFSILIRCDSGGPIQIAINEDDNLTTYIDLAANEEHKIDNSEAVIKSLNIRANGADAVTRIIGLY